MSNARRQPANAQLIREQMREKGLSQRTLAAAAGVNVNSITRLLGDELATEALLIKLAIVLGGGAKSYRPGGPPLPADLPEGLALSAAVPQLLEWEHRQTSDEPLRVKNQAIHGEPCQS